VKQSKGRQSDRYSYRQHLLANNSRMKDAAHCTICSKLKVIIELQHMVCEQTYLHFPNLTLTASKTRFRMVSTGRHDGFGRGYRTMYRPRSLIPARVIRQKEVNQC